MAVRGSSGVGVGEQSAQQGKGIAQGRSCSVGLTIGPQEGRQLAAGVHAPFDRQIEQQSLGFAQGKREAATIIQNFGGAEHGQT